MVALVGPTAAGKTRAAVALARATGGVVLSADARQAYRGLDVATGKEGEPGALDVPGLGALPARFLRGVPQIGLDLADARERFTAARWHAFAARAVHALLAAGTPVVVAGGTGLYVEALLRGFAWPDTDASVRARFADLPLRARRAAEVAALGQAPRAVPPAWSARVVGIDPPRAEHRAAIEERVRGWFASGDLAREVDALIAAGVPRDAEALNAIGYAEALSMREDGVAQQVAIGRAVARTWAYARRQRAYFRRRLPEVAWAGSVEEAVARAKETRALPLDRRSAGDP